MARSHETQADLVRIGSGAGFAGDRTDAAVPVVAELARHDGPRFLMFETLAERTLALCQLARRNDPAKGYSPAMEKFLAPCWATASPMASASSAFRRRQSAGAAARIAAMARDLGHAPRIGVVTGSDLDGLSVADLAARETGAICLRGGDAIVSADAISAPPPSRRRWTSARTSLSPAAWRTPRWRWGRCCMCSAGPRMTGTCSPPARWRAICWNAGRRSPAAISPIPASRMCRALRRWASPSPRSAATAASSSPSRRARAGVSTGSRSSSRCSTRSTIPPPISPRTW